MGEILLISNDWEMTELWQNALSELSLPIMSFVNASVALEYARAVPPLLVILDTRTPDIGELGFIFLHVFRAEEKLRSAPILCLDDSNEETHKTRALEIGFQGFLPKYCAVSDLLSLVEIYLGSVSNTEAKTS